MSEILNDPTFLAHRYDDSHDTFHFLPVTRHIHEESTFITDEFLPQNLSYLSIGRDLITQSEFQLAPAHFIFHSAYCCSTMLARAFNFPGISMGLKEPVLLNDMLGWRRRGAKPREWQAVLDQSLRLLSRPFGTDRAVIVKPSNVCNPIAMDILDTLPNAKAVLLFAPIESFLLSIAKKDMWGRIWARKLLTSAMADGYAVGGFSETEWLELTDLQVAGICWLSQHAIFAEIVKKYGPNRIKTLESTALLGHPKHCIRILNNHFGLGCDNTQIDNILSGPAFNSHSKLKTSYNSQDRDEERNAAQIKYGDELGMVAEWTKAVALSQNIKIDLGCEVLD